jgi:catechol 2,3-dioxygenase-like lactoylglutathione lyase family enzyme
MEEPIGTVTTVMHDTADLDAAVAFWTRLLGLEVVHRDDDYAYLSALAEGGPHLAFQRVPEARATKNRLHLDVRVPDKQEFADLVVSLGGHLVEEHEHAGFPVWWIMADAEGNEFCIYERSES